MFATNDRRRTSPLLWWNSTPPSSTGTSTYATGASPPGRAARSGKTVSIVVVRQPEKNAGTPIDSSRSTVVQSRQPTGP